MFSRKYLLRNVLIAILLLVGIGVLYVLSTINSDCGWGTTVTTWIDLDQDGLHDADEPPLEGVEFFVNDTFNNYDKVAGDRSDFNGQGSAFVFLPGCPIARFEIGAEAPQGYKLTTNSPIAVTGFGYGDEKPVEFGLAPLPGTILPAPYSPSMICKQYPDFEADDIVTSQQGVWKAEYKAISRLNSVTLKDEDNIQFPEGFPYARSIALTDHGFWLEGPHEWGYFDGETWSVLMSIESDVIIDMAPSHQISEDGRIWFVITDVMVTFDPNTGKAEVFTAQQHYSDLAFRIVVLTKNGDWFAALTGDSTNMERLLDGSWQVVLEKPLRSSEVREMPLISINAFAGSVVGLDGSLWIADYDTVARYVPSADRWLEYNFEDAGGSTFRGVGDIAVHPDGSIWLSDDRAVLQLIPLSTTAPNAKWRTFDARDGFLDGAAQHIAIDTDGRIWLFGEYANGLSVCQLTDNN